MEVHPKTKSEDPHLRSSMPHPKADFSKNQNKSRRVIPWPESSKRYFSRLTLRLFGVNEPRFPEKNIAEKCYLHRRSGGDDQSVRGVVIGRQSNGVRNARKSLTMSEASDSAAVARNSHSTIFLNSPRVAAPVVLRRKKSINPGTNGQGTRQIACMITPRTQIDKIDIDSWNRARDL